LDVPQDHKQAVAWYQKAADQGFAPAERHLATCYEHGIGVVKDTKATAFLRWKADASSSK
jgi:TPR repeat protein